MGLYKAFEENRHKVLPNLGELLALAETKPPCELLLMMDYRLPHEHEEAMNKIISIAVQLITTDADSRQFVIDNVFAASHELVLPVVTRLMELGRIEPLDLDAFNSLILHYCFSAAALVTTPLRVDVQAWKRGLAYLYEIAIKEKQ